MYILYLIIRATDLSFLEAVSRIGIHLNIHLDRFFLQMVAQGWYTFFQPFFYNSIYVYLIRKNDEEEVGYVEQ